MKSIDETLSDLLNSWQACVDSSLSSEAVRGFRGRLGAMPEGLSYEHRQFVAGLRRRLEIMIKKGRRKPASPTFPPGEALHPEADLPGMEMFLPDGRLDERASARGPGSRGKKGFREKLEKHKITLLRQEEEFLRARGQKLPLRFSGNDIPGHVVTAKEHDGLVHGGVITTHSYTLTCRAYISLEYQSKDMVAVVAGICRQKRPDGGVMGSWCTAQRLERYYTDPTFRLPAGAFISNAQGSHYHGFYIPLRWFVTGALARLDGTKIVIYEDSGVPLHPYIYNPPSHFNPSCHMFMQSPTHESAIENALYMGEHIESSPGFVIDSPYIKVFSPGPDSPRTIVSMVGAHRELHSSRNHLEYKREARWYVKTFTPDGME